MKGLLSGLIALLLTFGGGYFYGKHVEKKVQQAEVDRLNAEARAKEAALTVAVNTPADALRKTNEKAKTAAKERDAAITAGTYKLRVPVKTTCPVYTPADTPAPAGDSVQTNAELDREVAKSLIAITDDGDKAIRQLNACIDAYNTVYQTLKGNP